MSKWQDVIRRLDLLVEVTPIPMRTERLNGRSEQDAKWDAEAAHFVVSVSLNQPHAKPFRLAYSCGSGHLDNFAREHHRDGRTEDARRALSGGRSVFDEELRNRLRTWARERFKPAPAELVESIAGDLCSAEDYPTFAAYCDNFGMPENIEQLRSMEWSFDTTMRQAEAARDTLRHAYWALIAEARAGDDPAPEQDADKLRGAIREVVEAWSEHTMQVPADVIERVRKMVEAPNAD